MKVEFICDKEGILKEYLQEKNLSRRFLKNVKLYGNMYINGEIVKNYYNVKINDVIVLEYNEKQNENINIVQDDLNILYEDEYFMIISKKFNLACQPSRKHFEDNLICYLKYYFLSNNIDSNVHIVNRLDYATSGLMTIAKNGYSHFMLTNNLVMTKKYYAIVEGILDKKEGIINLPIRREYDDSIKRIVASDGKEAITKYKVVKENKEKNLSLVDISLLTGRTHQIRVHFSYLGHPLLGDKLYGKESDRLYLHCYNLSFISPFDNKEINITDIPEFYNEF